jgi:hypothetical protein
MSEINEFLKDLGVPGESLLEKPLIEVEAPEEEVSVEDEKRLKNRLMRRKEKEAERLRDEVSQLNEVVKRLSEVDKFKAEAGDDPFKKVEAIFGTDTPEKLAATNLLKEALQGVSQKTKSELQEELNQRSEQETEAQKEADSEVDQMLEQVEDDYGLDMSDDNVRKGYITLMEKMSRKYDDGNIKEFADPDAVAETYLELQKRQTSSKARELASRSMTRSGESQPSKLPQNAIDRFMEENGLTGNW